ncbi:hypothetical protein DRN75_01320, partial [Nanoarchaeota archaeon]
MDFNFIAERVKLSLTSPKELVKKAVKDDFNDVLVYFLVIALPTAILLPVFGGSLLMELFGTGTGYSAMLLSMVALYVVTLLNLFIGGAWLHLWVYVLGGKQGIKQTWKAMIYASTPSL